MHYLLVQPKYYSQYPPLGLLKLSRYLKNQKNTVEFIKGTEKPRKDPDEIYVTSLFTYAWRIVHESIAYYKQLFHETPITLGGIYASLMPEHAKSSGAEVHQGLFHEAENLMPDYDLVKEWNASIVFSSRGCIRKCGFCAVPVLEPKFEEQRSILPYIYNTHTRIIFWDNNFLASRYYDNILKELKDLKKPVDFNHGLDARLITPNIARDLKSLHMRYLHLAYDSLECRGEIDKAIQNLKEAGFRGRDLIFYTLFNFVDTPNDFLTRIQDLLGWGVVSYPMRFIPLHALDKKYVGPKWTAEMLEMVADARRVLGIRGTLPPYLGLKNKMCNAKTFEEAFALLPTKNSGFKVGNRISNNKIEDALKTIFSLCREQSFIKKSSIIKKMRYICDINITSESTEARVIKIADVIALNYGFQVTDKRIKFLNPKGFGEIHPNRTEMTTPSH